MTLGSAPPESSRFFPIGKARQRGERTRIGRLLLDLQDRAGAAREARQSEREFLSNGFADIDEIVNERLERLLLVNTIRALVLRRAIAQRETCRHRAVDRIERHDALLHEGGFEGGAQQDRVLSLADEVNLGRQAIESQQAETPGERLALRLGRCDLPAK